MQLVRRGVRTERVSGSARTRCVISEGISPKRVPYEPSPSLSLISIPNPFKTLCYSCLDIVKPHFQHRHYVKHVAKADKSNNGFGASTATEGDERVKDFPIAHPDRSRRPFDRPTLSAPLCGLTNRLIFAGRELCHRRQTRETCRRSSYLNYAIQVLSVISVPLKIK